MTDKEFQNLILEKLNNFETRFDNLEKGQANLEKGQANLEKGQANLEKGQKSLQKSFNRLENNFNDFRDETDSNFKYTNEMVNQAFEKISENMEYQDKVNTVIDILKQNKSTGILSKSRKRTLIKKNNF